LFARQVLNAAPGTCARLLGLRGMHSVVCAAEASGLVAAIYAAELLATRRDVDALIAAHLDDAHGATCTLLSAAPSDVRVASWHVAGPGRGVALDGDATALDLLAGAQLIRSGRARRVVVTQCAPACGDFAVVLIGGSCEP
jgi:hypothetical protein